MHGAREVRAPGRPEAQGNPLIADYLVILNPASNRGGAARVGAAVERAFLRLGARAEVVHTRARRDGERLAHAAAREGRGAVVAVGGDGVVHEVANGLLAAAGDGPTVPMGVVAAGSGNDFAKMIGVPRGRARQRLAVAGRAGVHDVGAGAQPAEGALDRRAHARRPAAVGGRVENDAVVRDQGIPLRFRSSGRAHFACAVHTQSTR